MGRKKVSLQWITNDASRRATFNRRRQALIKKTSELATLCGVKVCVLVYGEKEVQPEVWPSVPEAMNLLTSYKATSELKQWNKKTSHEDFLKSRIAKLREQVRKSDLESQGRETSILFHEAMSRRRPGLAGATPAELIRLREVVERKMKAVQERLKQLGVEPEQLPPVWSVIQRQVPHTFTQMVRERVELGGVVSGNSSSAGSSTASTSQSGGDVVQPRNQGGRPWNTFPSME